MANILANWKTSLGGLVLIALAVCKTFGISVAGVALPDLSTALAAGLALIFASDSSVTK